MAMFEKLTGQARRAMELACRQARRCHHDYLGTEHILVGLVTEGSSSILRVLDSCRVTAVRLLENLEELWPVLPDGRILEELPLTQIAKTALAEAEAEARRQHQGCAGPVHLLFGLLDNDGVAALLLKELGVD